MSATPIECGTHVTWEGKAGRVDLVVSSGVVPGVEGEVTGTSDAPVARVIVGEAKVAVPVAALTATEPPVEYKSEAAALVGLLADHARRAETKGAAATLSADAVQAAFERGLHGWPGETVTTLTPDEWAVGRVELLSKAAITPESVAGTAFADGDLLDPSNPASSATPPPAPKLASPSPEAPPADLAPTTRPRVAKPRQEVLDFTGQDPEDPEPKTPALPGDGQADPGGDEGEDGNPDASAEGTTVNAAQLQEILGDWDAAAAPEDGSATDET